MPSTNDAPPLVGDSLEAYKSLRQQILSGVLAPGHPLNTVHISQEFGVSRTPVREALRMLQSEGLVDAPYHHRLRVTQVSASEVDAIYATWILLQSLAIGLTVEAIKKDELKILRETVKTLQSVELDEVHRPQWDEMHMKYNALIVQHAGSHIVSAIHDCWLQSERARRLNMSSKADVRRRSNKEHAEVLRAFEKGDSKKAVALEGSHLARGALAVIKLLDENHQAPAIHQALKLTDGR